MRLAGRVLHWFITLFFICLLLLLALTLVAPRWMGMDMLGVASGSMSPTIPVGSVVLIKPVGIETILPGEIITFQSPEMPGSVVTHRVVEVTVSGGERAFRTQGDGNDDSDLELVPASKVRGRVLFDLPYLGHLSKFIRTTRGWFLIIMVPAAILILMELLNILRVIWSNDTKTPQERMPN